jgi:hypothetical protein
VARQPSFGRTTTCHLCCRLTDGLHVSRLLSFYETIVPSVWQAIHIAKISGTKTLMMKNSKRTTTLFLTVLFVFALFSGTSISANGTAGEEEAKQELKQQKNPYANAEITIKIIPSTRKTFGYDILVDGKPLVHQPNIPAMPGNEGFSTRKRAKTVAEFVVKKIRKNEMPPTVTIEDLNNMDVLKSN